MSSDHQRDVSEPGYVPITKTPRGPIPTETGKRQITLPSVSLEGWLKIVMILGGLVIGGMRLHSEIVVMQVELNEAKYAITELRTEVRMLHDEVNSLKTEIARTNGLLEQRVRNK